MLVCILLSVHYRPRPFLYTVRDICTHAYTYVSLRVNRKWWSRGKHGVFSGPFIVTKIVAECSMKEDMPPEIVLLKKKNAGGFTYFQNKNVPAIFRSTEAEVSISVKETKHLEFQTFQVVTTFTKSQVEMYFFRPMKLNRLQNSAIIMWKTTDSTTDEHVITNHSIFGWSSSVWR